VMRNRRCTAVSSHTSFLPLVPPRGYSKNEMLTAAIIPGLEVDNRLGRWKVVRP
jgi:hypothetical protein